MKKLGAIAIVDDGGNLGREPGAWFAQRGFVVSEHDLERGALTRLLAAAPSLILLTISAARQEQGLVFYRKLAVQRQLRHLPVLVVSDCPDLEYELLDVFDFLTLPIDYARLQANLQRLAARSRPAGVLPGLASQDLEPFKLFLQEQSGLHFSQNNQRLLERGLVRRMQALRITGAEEYLNFLTAAETNFDELNKLLGLLTVGETCFFRYRAHRDALVQSVIPALIAKAGQSRRLRFWSAGCSTGEEPYSLALMLSEYFPQLVDWDVQILATDINKRSLRLAREGIYKERSLRLIEGAVRSRYFRQLDGHYLLDRRIRSMVRFNYFNLQTDPFPEPLNGTSGLDLILCRNVLIYFDLETIRSIVERFRGSLGAHGYLFLGHSETMQNVSDRFQRLHQHGAFFYQVKAAEIAGPAPAKTPPAVIMPPPRPKPPVPLPEVRPLARPEGRREERPPAPAAPPVAVDRLYAQAMSAFDHEDYAGAERLFTEGLALQPQHAPCLIGMGLLQANRGDYDAARQYCARAIRHDDLCPEAYLLRGLILDMQGELERALVEYQKVIWLDREFTMAHYLMAKVHARLHQPEAHARALRNTLRYLEKAPETGLVPFSGGLTRAVFLEVCCQELAGLG